MQISKFSCQDKFCARLPKKKEKFQRMPMVYKRELSEGERTGCAKRSLEKSLNAIALKGAFLSWAEPF